MEMPLLWLTLLTKREVQGLSSLAEVSLGLDSLLLGSMAATLTQPGGLRVTIAKAHRCPTDGDP